MLFGGEWLWKDMVALRAGYRQELGRYQDPLTGPTFGVGAGKERVWWMELWLSALSTARASTVSAAPVREGSAA